MTEKEIIRITSIEFAYWMQIRCFYNINGYMLLGDELDDNEYQVDELFDYWFENIFPNYYKQEK